MTGDGRRKTEDGRWETEVGSFNKFNPLLIIDFKYEHNILRLQRHHTNSPSSG